MASSLYFRI